MSDAATKAKEARIRLGDVQPEDWPPVETTYHVSAEQTLRYTIAVRASSRAEAIEKLNAACEDGGFDPFLQHEEEDVDEGDILNYVMEGGEPIFDGDR